MTTELLSTLAGAVALPDPDVIRRTADEVVRRPEFQINPVRDANLILRFFLSVFRSVFDFLERLWIVSPLLAVLMIIFLVAVLVALIAHIVYSLSQGLRVRVGLGPVLSSQRRQMDPARWEREAEEAADRHDYIGAVRLLFRAAVVRLDQRAGRTARPGTTNREYLARYRASNVIEALRQFVDVIDAKWYGAGQCDVDDYQRCRQAHALIHGAD